MPVYLSNTLFTKRCPPSFPSCRRRPFRMALEHFRPLQRTAQMFVVFIWCLAGVELVEEVTEYQSLVGVDVLLD